jgi:hypothetical protein
MKLSLSALAALAAMTVAANAASVSIQIDSGGKSLRNENNVVLSGGLSGTPRDGTQVVLGYFTDSSQAAPFGPVTNTTDITTTFVALTGPGTPFGVNFTIGDDVTNGTGNGELFIDAFPISTGIADALLPAPGTPLVLRFFNAERTRILDLANGAGLWSWRAPATVPPAVVMSFDDPGLVMRATGMTERGALAAAEPNLLTLNPIPEPASLALVACGALLLGTRRQRR